MRAPPLLLLLAAALLGTLACERSPGRAPAAPSHAISGTVAGAPAAGVTVTLSGASSATVVTAPDGSYVFAGVGDGSYSVTPSLPGHGFSPASRPVAVRGADRLGADFAAAPVPRLGAVEPAQASPGATVTVTGEGFGAWRPGSSVLVGLQPLQVVSWSDDRIVARVPRGTLAGALRVVAAGAASTPLPFAVSSAVLASTRVP